MFITLLVFLIVLAFVAWAVFTLIPMDATIAIVVRAMFGIVALVAVLDALGITHTGVLSVAHGIVR